MEQSIKGKSLISFYKNNGHLTEYFRSELINIIIEDVFYHDIKLSPADLPKIIDEVLENFPNEIRVSIVYTHILISMTYFIKKCKQHLTKIFVGILLCTTNRKK